MSTTVLEQRIEWPVLCAPWGGQALVHRAGEIGMAQAAKESGTAFCLSTFSSFSLEEVADAAPGPRFFQLHPARSNGMMSELMERARASGYTALVLTVDNPTRGKRERDLRSGFGSPPRFTLRSWLSIASKPRWAYDMVRSKRGYGNFRNYLNSPGRDMGWIMDQLLCTSSWDMVARLAEQWRGPFAIKGVMSADDARLAAQAGVTAVVVSNQGGRHFDCAPATFEVLQDVIDAVGDNVEVILDGGLRRGSDVLKAIALGGKACMTARPFAFGLAAGGQAGAARALEILKSEIQRDMVFMGARDLSEVTLSCLRPRTL